MNGLRCLAYIFLLLGSLNATVCGFIIFGMVGLQYLNSEFYSFMMLVFNIRYYYSIYAFFVIGILSFYSGVKIIQEKKIGIYVGIIVVILYLLFMNISVYEEASLSGSTFTYKKETLITGMSEVQNQTTVLSVINYTYPFIFYNENETIKKFDLSNNTIYYFAYNLTLGENYNLYNSTTAPYTCVNRKSGLFDLYTLKSEENMTYFHTVSTAEYANLLHSNPDTSLIYFLLDLNMTVINNSDNTVLSQVRIELYSYNLPNQTLKVEPNLNLNLMNLILAGSLVYLIKKRNVFV